MATTAWVAGLYNEIALQPAPALRAALLGLPEFEDRSVRVSPLPPVAEEFYNDLFGYKLWEQRAGLQGSAEFDARQVLLLRSPSAFDEVEWQRFAGTRAALATSEEDAGFRPVIPLWAWDEADWQRAFARILALPVEDEAPERLPLTPTPVPNLGWDDFEWGHDFAFRGLAALLPMDEFVNAPLSGGIVGGASRGRAARLGFFLPAFR